jgi:restriction system protein
MADAPPTLWGIHAGRTGDADALFLRKRFIAIGWAEVGNLAEIKPDREAFRARVAECFPDRKPGSIRGAAGQMFRFVHEMIPGDLVAYPAKLQRQIHMGATRLTATLA